MNNYAAWSATSVVDFYERGRHRLEDLYPSERALLIPALEEVESVLDFGCAAGGLFEILQRLKPGIRYLGVDVSSAMIEKARRIHPLGNFEGTDGTGEAFDSEAFDLVLSTGVLNHVPHYPQLIHQLYRISKKGCLIDLPRLVMEPYRFDSNTSYIMLLSRFSDAATQESSRTRVPYVLVNPKPLFEFLVKDLTPTPYALAAVGYYGKPNPLVVIPVEEVCFCVCYLAKGDSNARRRTRLFLDVPPELIEGWDESAMEIVLGRHQDFPAGIFQRRTSRC